MAARDGGESELFEYDADHGRDAGTEGNDEEFGEFDRDGGYFDHTRGGRSIIMTLSRER
ncbi:hypothetical protein BN903_16 [Halorubrum sp. AJ67]|nr:hypothetical protein BN903_16 [Halorubrum sp. AJ67]